MKVSIYFTVVFIILSSSSKSQIDKYVLFDSSYAPSILRQCSRSVPEIEGVWNPSPSDVKSLESNLEQISKLKSTDCCLLDAQIPNPSYYCRQYVGIIVKGRKVIYINAFVPLMGTNLRTSDPNYWRKNVIVICDGGESVWGCEYDVQNNCFYNLSINGVA